VVWLNFGDMHPVAIHTLSDEVSSTVHEHPLEASP
jgi:hypothetical protein